ncbi:MAG: DUF2062 domain-containing protein [Sulfurimicrobium sp.]|jgi:hypothetical protein|nr:DUF2062 domain-containing protein [Sulfurimicrobium sp.]MDP1704617.1 DUF2062 domain-containing protein [Sulfurimicrobium sp.]MDP2197180.1 DUF2062 domain-containing protein [Sulfurimicrobium sp.]MDP2963259.1 DUF2062 domain-containing protein [Sulfurimicrobium sp.]MDP3688783.1 DUF2062 domain-containing protein [Sulfurimicrobium sp.]
MKNRFKQLLPNRERLLASRWLRWLGPLLHHPQLWHWSRRGVSMGVAIGVFFGLLIPVAQIPISATAAVLLRANLPAAAASTLVTNPVTFAPIYYAAYKLGAWITGEDAEKSVPNKPALPADAEEGFWERIAGIGLPLLVGLSITATIAGLACYVLISLGWYLYVMRKRRRKR